MESLLAILVASMAITPSAWAQRTPPPVVQAALDNDPQFAELYNADTDSDNAYLDLAFAIVGYVGDNYPRDDELYLDVLTDAVQAYNIVDFDGRYEAELRERLVEAVPLAEATLGPDHRDTEYLTTWRRILLEQAGLVENADGNQVAGSRLQEVTENEDSWYDDFWMFDEPLLGQMVALREAREGLSGEALIDNLREEARLQREASGIYWHGYHISRFAILHELYQIGEWEQMEAEAAEMLALYTADGDLGNELAITSGQYLALARELRGDLAGAAEALAPLVTHPSANRGPPESIYPKVGDPMQPDHREGQARSQLARLLLEGDGDADLARESASFGTRYLIGLRTGRAFTQDVEEHINSEFDAPDEPFGQDAAQQFANLVEATWRVREEGGGTDVGMLAEAFAAAQEAMQDRTTPAIARTAAIAVAERVGLDDLAREREDLTAAMQMLEGTEYLQARARQQDIDRELLEAAPEFFSLIRPSALSLEAAQALLAPGEAMLLILPTQYGTHVLALTPDAATWHKSEWTEADFRSQARALRNDLDPWGAGIVNNWDGGFDANSAWILYRELIEPLMPALEGSDALLYATGPAVSSIPLTVLLMEEPANPEERQHDYRAMEWLGDRFAMAQLPSLSSLAFLRRDGAATHGSRTMVGFADPVLEGEAATRGGRNAALVGSQRLATVAGPGSNQTALADLTSLRALSRLPGTALEVQMLAETLALEDGSVFIGPAATETAVKSLDLSDVRYLVFATHGLTAGEGGIAAEPGLVFTPPEEATVADDGLLTASEILALDLSADWVMLSACNTAAADGIGGGGLSGLARSFFYAGARSLLASHWPVIDEIAPLLTTTSVRLLEDNPGMSRAAALQQAMVEVRNNADIERADHPSSWAPFITVGDLR